MRKFVEGATVGRVGVPIVGRVAVLGIALCAALLSAGCNKSPVKLYPVQGKVLYKDQPVAGAQVVLRPQEENQNNPVEAKEKPPLAFGTVAADGTVVMRSDYQGQAIGEGVAPGTYNVLITWYGADAKNPEKSVNKLPAKYSDQSKPAYTVTVKPEKNVLEPFQLK
jgi:hypothetical protein